MSENTEIRIGELPRNEVNVPRIETNGDVAIMKEIAPKFGVEILTLATEGVNYYPPDMDPKKRPVIPEDKVPVGSSFIKIYTEPGKNDLTKFHQAFIAKKAEIAKIAKPTPAKI